MIENLPVKATSIEGISKMFGLGKSTLRRAIREGSLRTSRVGRRILIKIIDAESFIDNSSKQKMTSGTQDAGGDR